MDIVARVKGILLSPKTEWPKIAAEPMTAQQIYTNWVLILAAIGPIATLIGIGISSGFGFSIRLAIATYVMMLVMVAVVALVIDLLAPHFGGTKDFVAALKLSAFSYTAAYLAGVFHLLGSVGGILVLIASLYAWYRSISALRSCASARPTRPSCSPSSSSSLASCSACCSAC